jgi:nitrite reductase (NADH) small subunit
MTAAATRHRVGPLAEIPPGEGRAYPVAGEQVAVFRLRSGELRAVSAVCPHAGGPIADGIADDRTVICPLHQHRYELATGNSTTGQPPLRVYEAYVDESGQVVVVTSADQHVLTAAPERCAADVSRPSRDPNRAETAPS